MPIRILILLAAICLFPSISSGQVELEEPSVYEFLDSLFFDNKYDSIIAHDTTFKFGLMMDYHDVDMNSLKKVPKSYIEEISYLKPESATKLFGELGQRGAIIISTKDTARTKKLFNIKTEN
ncbi:hypothetical protein E1176_02010 [Fulvivirga sp. RKSG066]|uniref:hypothetical protein n=1 Tax=Fulvivirga aurantia TaxID=2529383 RepID=UPI0012BCEA82|nr:hypothetical protein [Fulvivirga aurantia]MTI19787.1 hypothetical protein [Fulvivirga aurantia]